MQNKERKTRIIPSTLTDRLLYKLFIKPFIQANTFTEEELDFQEGINRFFGVGYRDVDWCKATEAFEMPGSIWESPDMPNRWYHSGGDREVKAGDELIVRTDDRTPDRIDIEFKDQVFMLKHSQWVVIRDKVKRIT